MTTGENPLSDVDHAAYQAVLYQSVYERHGFGPEKFFVPTIFAETNGVEFGRAVAERMFQLRRDPGEMESIRERLSHITVGEWIDGKR